MKNTVQDILEGKATLENTENRDNTFKELHHDMANRVSKFKTEILQEKIDNNVIERLLYLERGTVFCYSLSGGKKKTVTYTQKELKKYCYNKIELRNILEYLKQYNWRIISSFIDEMSSEVFELIFLNKMDDRLKRIILENRANEAIESCEFHSGKRFSKEFKNEIESLWNN